MGLKKLIIKYIDNKNDLKEKKILRQVLKDQKINFADIGAAGGLKPRWKKMSKFIHLYAFEPNYKIHKKLREELNEVASLEIIGKAIWDSNGVKDFHLNKGPNESSILKSNKNFVGKFLGKERFEQEEIFSMNTTTIDTCIKNQLDALKIDIQGGSFNALEGSIEQLNNIFTIELETEFFKVYEGQKTFFEIFDFLTKKGYIFEDFTELHRWNRAKNGLIGGSLIYGDALFIKNPDLVDLDNEEIFRKYFSLLFLYRKYDLCFFIFNKLNQSSKQKYKATIHQLYYLSKKAKLKEYLSKIFMRLVGTGASSKSIF